MISKRSLSLSKTYVILSSFLSVLGIVFANTGTLITGIGQSVATNATAPIRAGSLLPLISIPMLVFATLSFTTPVLLLYVYDKNNGVLEYFLSLGMDQVNHCNHSPLKLLMMLRYANPLLGDTMYLRFSRLHLFHRLLILKLWV